jgi:hypothetical protein
MLIAVSPIAPPVFMILVLITSTGLLAVVVTTPAMMELVKCKGTPSSHFNLSLMLVKTTGGGRGGRGGGEEESACCRDNRRKAEQSVAKKMSLRSETHSVLMTSYEPGAREKAPRRQKRGAVKSKRRHHERKRIGQRKIK